MKPLLPLASACASLLVSVALAANPAPWKLEGDAMVCVPKGNTPNRGYPAYKAHAERLPLLLQDHNNLTAFRNIWVRELKLPATP